MITLINWVRLRNRVAQWLYKPVLPKPNYLSEDAVSFLDELDKAVEEKITPLLADLFN